MFPSHVSLLEVIEHTDMQLNFFAGGFTVWENPKLSRAMNGTRGAQ